MGSEENVGYGEEESEDRNYSPAPVVSSSCATVKLFLKKKKGEEKNGGKVGEGRQFGQRGASVICSTGRTI